MAKRTDREPKPDAKSELIGFVRVLELYLGPQKPVEVHPVLRIKANEPYIAALMRLEAAGKPLGVVIDDEGRTIGFVTAEHLSEPLFRGK